MIPLAPPPAVMISAPSIAPMRQVTCRVSLDSLDAKVRVNYAGHRLEVTGVRAVQHRDLLGALRTRADSTPLPRCFAVLDAYVRWYDDPHLFVFQSGTTDSLTARARGDALRRVPIREDSLRDALKRPSRRDPIEGIWFDGALRLAVVPDPAGPRGTFVAVVLHSDTTAWPVGAVRAELRRRAASGAHTGPSRASRATYDVRMLTRGFAETQHIASLHRNDLLRLSPGMWGRAWPRDPARGGMLDSADVHRPTAVRRAGSVVFSIPSHDPQFARRLDSLVTQHAAALREVPLLIVDLRGNEGGGSGTTRALHPYIASPERRLTPFDSGTPVMVASPAQLAYARRIVGNDTSAVVRRILQRLEQEPGAFVTLDPFAPTFSPEPSIPGNWRVVVMVDGGTVSAAEVTVLQALRSRRAIVVGEPTAGALDYQSTQIISLGTGHRQWALGYPTITAHAELPQRGMRGKGIQPEVFIRWADVADAMAEVERRFGDR